MPFKKILFCLVIGLIMVTGAAFAADNSASIAPLSYQEEAFQQWEWPEVGLTFDYPASWQVTTQGQFEFILFNPALPGEQVSEYVGLQTGALTGDDTLQSIMEEFAGQFEGELTETTFGGVPAYQIELPENDGIRVFVIGFSPAENEVALFNYQAAAEHWEAFQPVIDRLLESAQVHFIALESTDLNAQLQASFAETQTLTVGNADAPVKVVEVLDFSCPHCVNYGSSVDRIIHDKVLAGDVQLEFVFVTFVGQAFSDTATQAMYCAAEAGYGWDMHNLLMDGYQVQSTGFYNIDTIVNAVEAADFDADAEALRACIESAPYDAVIASNTERASDYDANSTPSLLFAKGDDTPAFIIDEATGEPLRGGLPLIYVYERIEALLTAD